MKKSKVDKFMTRVMMFCWKHKFAIGLSTAMIGAYCIGSHNQEAKFKAQQKAIDDEKARQERVRQYEENLKAHYEDPANQLSCGGVVVDDAFDEGDGTASMILSQVPLEKLGEFGEAVKERMISHPGTMEPEDLSDILGHNPHCDVVITIYPGEEKEVEEPCQEHTSNSTD